MIIDADFDPLLGARPLRRSIQRLIEDRLAEGVLNGDFPDGSHILIAKGEKELTFAVAPAPAPVPAPSSPPVC